MRFTTQRIYDRTTPRGPAERRVLIDRLWPRGLARADAAVDHWARDLAPSTALRQWFAHDPAKYAEFTTRYQAELDANRSAVTALLTTLRAERAEAVTLLYAARDDRPHHAPVLRAYLEARR